MREEAQDHGEYVHSLTQHSRRSAVRACRRDDSLPHYHGSTPPGDRELDHPGVRQHSDRGRVGVGVRYAIALEAAWLPHRVEGRILPLDEAGKESHAYRQPLGVIGVISAWNFPMYLSNRSFGPELALGSGVVIKPAEDTPVTGGPADRWPSFFEAMLSAQLRRSVASCLAECLNL